MYAVFLFVGLFTCVENTVLILAVGLKTAGRRRSLQDAAGRNAGPWKVSLKAIKSLKLKKNT